MGIEPRCFTWNISGSRCSRTVGPSRRAAAVVGSRFPTDSTAGKPGHARLFPWEFGPAPWKPCEARASALVVGQGLRGRIGGAWGPGAKMRLAMPGVVEGSNSPAKPGQKDDRNLRRASMGRPRTRSRASWETVTRAPSDRRVLRTRGVLGFTSGNVDLLDHTIRRPPQPGMMGARAEFWTASTMADP